MASVTQRIKAIKQPYGGYLPIKYFEIIPLEDNSSLYENENVHSSIVGLAVDYLTRYSLGVSAIKAFNISLKGSRLIRKYTKAMKLVNNISGLDDKSIISACKLSGFDVCYRSSVIGYKPIEEIEPDLQTIENIRIMVRRSLSFFEKYGPVVNSELTFLGGYTNTVNAGDGDFLTQDTLWDFKVSNSKITSKHTLQILMYYIMGSHSVHECYKNVKKLGFFNPRLNLVYLCSVEKISKEIIKEVERDVICYGNRPVVSKSKTTSKETNNDLTVVDVCQISGMPKKRIYQDIRIGRLPAYKKGNKYFIKQEEFEKYYESLKAEIKTIFIGLLIFVPITIIVLLIFLI